MGATHEDQKIVIIPWILQLLSTLYTGFQSHYQAVTSIHGIPDVEMNPEALASIRIAESHPHFSPNAHLFR
jgi:hypothetical protein